jgi:hypothetical protein
MSSDLQPSAGASAAPGEPTPGSHPHDFEAQKQVHRKIRNDPDYDDWEYGTEPLPHEAWLAKQAQGSPGPEGTGGSSEGSSAGSSTR